MQLFSLKYLDKNNGLTKQAQNSPRQKVFDSGRKLQPRSAKTCLCDKSDMQILMQQFLNHLNVSSPQPAQQHYHDPRPDENMSS